MAEMKKQTEFKLYKRDSVFFDQNTAPVNIAYAHEVNDVAILPLGAIEQHGPHCPNGLDSFNAICLAKKVAEKSGATVLPCPMYGGHPYMHMGMPGTITLNYETNMALLHDIIASASNVGYNKFIMLVAHGADSSFIPAVHKLGMEGYFVLASTWYDFLRDNKNVLEDFMWHADEAETSMALSLYGDLVHMDASVKKRLETIVDSKNLTMVSIYGQQPVSVEEMWAWCEKYSKLFAPYVCDVGQYLAEADEAGKKIMFEAQLGALRDIDFGIYPYTTSSNVIGAYAPIGAGIPGHKLHNSIGVMKAYSSCVGDGPFTAELAMTEEEKHALREAGHEYGAATGRPRRVGPIDLVASRYGVFCQGCDEVALTLLDVLDYMDKIPMVTAYKLSDGTTTTRFPMGEALDTAQPVVEYLPGWHCDITAARKWEDLPKEAQAYVEYLEKAVGCKITYISVGAEREAYIHHNV